MTQFLKPFQFQDMSYFKRTFSHILIEILIQHLFLIFLFPLGLLDDTSMSPLDVTAYQPSSDDINLDSSLSPADLSPSPSPD